MTLAENPSIHIDELDSERPAIFKFQVQRNPDPIASLLARFEIDGAFDAVKAWNGKAGIVVHALVADEAVRRVAQRHAIQQEFPDA